MGIGKRKDRTNAFGEALRQLRTDRGVSQAKLAEAARIHVVSLAKLEAGTRKPAWETIVSLADALGVSLDAFRPTGSPVVKPVAEAAEAAAGEGDRVRKPGKQATTPKRRKSGG